MKTGIYYNESTEEIKSVADENIGVGSDWRFVTSQGSLGLLAVRSMLVEQGLVNDERTVYWHFPQPIESTPDAFLCNVPSTRHAGSGWSDGKRASLRSPSSA